MGEWKQIYEPKLGGCIDVDGKLYNSNSNVDALLLIDVHNADIAALSAERDELQRRLDRADDLIADLADDLAECLECGSVLGITEISHRLLKYAKEGRSDG